MKRAAAVVFAGLAVVFFGIGHVLMPMGMEARGFLPEVAVAPVLAMGLFLVGGAFPLLDAAGRLICGLWPGVAFILVCGTGGEAAAYLAGFGVWPLLVAGMAAGLALVPQRARQLPTLALFPFGAVLALSLVAVLLPVAPGVARILGQTPYHFVITMTFAATMIGLIDAATAGLTAARERLIRSLAAMMPLLGFLGTIFGLIGALGGLPALFEGGDRDPAALAQVIGGLSAAFETTLLGLIGAASCNFLLVLLADREATRA